MLRIFLCFALLSSCVTRDESYYLRKGENVKVQLLSELQSIGSLQDLFRKQESLTLLFDEIARLAVEASTSLPSKGRKPCIKSDDVVSREITGELRRILLIPGAFALLEKCQAKGLESMDRHVRTRLKKRRT